MNVFYFSTARFVLTRMTCILLCVVAGQVVAAGDPANGEAKTTVCAACHGQDGNSAAPANPKLAGQGEKYLFKQLKDIQTKKREVLLMTGLLDELSDADLQDIAAYYASQTQTLGAADEEWVELGREIYRAGNADRSIPACTGCHGPAGKGNAPAAYPMLAGQHADYIAQQLRNFSVGTRHNDGEAKTMRDIAQRMNENEIKAVASYIEGLR